MDEKLFHRISTVKGKQYAIDEKYCYYAATVNGYRLRYVYSLSKTWCLRQLLVDDELAHILGFPSVWDLRRLFRTRRDRKYITPKALRRKFM